VFPAANGSSISAEGAALMALDPAGHLLSTRNLSPLIAPWNGNGYSGFIPAGLLVSQDRVTVVGSVQSGGFAAQLAR
jgi:hypothetical protein